jgi:UDP-N-acetylmuramyl tripeptide synthase
MIGGLVALALDKSVLRQLGEGRHTVVVTGTNGKSTTTRMTAAALGTLGASEPEGRRHKTSEPEGRRHKTSEPEGRRHKTVATNAEGANMDAGLVAALAGARDASLAALEVDEMHVPHVADAVDPAVIVLLNLSRDQLDRVGEINQIERTLRGGLARHPSTVVVANCDDVLMTSAAYDSPHVVWVAAGGGWANDSVSCPRSGEVIVRDGSHWYSTGTDFKRPTPQWWYDDANIYGPEGLSLPMALALPGTVNRGNATQAVAAAVTLGVDPAAAVAAVSGVDEVAGRYSTVQLGAHSVRMLLAKNPAGWQEALSMVDTDAGSVVISVNGQVPDGEDLSWLWDVNFEHFVDGQLARRNTTEPMTVVAAGERGTDLAVRLGYAGVEHTLVHNAVEAITSCPPGHVEVVANYTAFLHLNRTFGRAGR